MHSFRLLLLISLLLPLQILAQPIELTSKSKKACKAYLKAAQYYQANDLAYADIELERALNADPGFIEAWMMRGDIKEDQKNIEEAIKCYTRAVEINPDFFPRNFLTN